MAAAGEEAAAAPDDDIEHFQSIRRWIFVLKPTLSPEKAKKTAGIPKSNTQESRNLELINLPPGSNTCLPAI